MYYNRLKTRVILIVLITLLMIFGSVAYCRENTAPTGAISVDGTYAMKNGKKAVPGRNVTLRILASDAGSGVNRICILNENSLNSISWISWTDSSLVATGVANTKTKAWTLTAGDGEKTIYLIVEDKDGNTSVVPTTTFRYTINYDLKGGSNGPSAGAKEVGKAYTISSTIPTKTNYDFMGWDTSSAGTTAVYKGGDKYYANADFTLYAYWQPHYTIVFNGNNNTGGSTASLGMTYSVAKNLTANGFTRTGYTFSKWNTQANGGGTNYNNQQSVNNLTSTAGKTFNLYAQWTANTYTVTLNSNGGTGGTTSVTATYNSAMPSATMPTRAEGWYGNIGSIGNKVSYNKYTFDGYYDSASGGTKYYNADGTSARTWNKTSNTTLYAHWTTIGESFYVAIKNGSTVKLLTEYYVNPSTNSQSRYNYEAINFSSTPYWYNGPLREDQSWEDYLPRPVNSPYNLTNDSNITSDKYALFYAKQYGAKYGVTGTLLTKDEVDNIASVNMSQVGSPFDFYWTNTVSCNWPSWLNGYDSNPYWLGSAGNDDWHYYVWAVFTSSSASKVLGEPYKWNPPDVCLRPVIIVPTSAFN